MQAIAFLVENSKKGLPIVPNCVSTRVVCVSKPEFVCFSNVNQVTFDTAYYAPIMHNGQMDNRLCKRCLFPLRLFI